MASQNSSFEKIYKKYYIPLITEIQDNIKRGNAKFPAKEDQDDLIKKSEKEKCEYMFIVDLSKDAIMPLKENDQLYPFPNDSENSLKEFFARVHQVFLIPFLSLAGRSYELARDAQTSRQEILTLGYEVELPLKLPGDETHRWYTQKSKILTIDENNQVIRHINFYVRGQELFVINDKPEHMLMSASIFREDKSAYTKFEKDMKKKMAKYYWEEVLKVKHRALIQSHIMSPDPKISYPLNKQIHNLMLLYTTYSFKDIEEVIDFLELWGCDFGLVKHY